MWALQLEPAGAVGEDLVADLCDCREASVSTKDADRPQASAVGVLLLAALRAIGIGGRGISSALAPLFATTG